METKMENKICKESHPRFGFSVDVLGGGKLKVFAGSVDT